MFKMSQQHFGERENGLTIIVSDILFRTSCLSEFEYSDILSL